MTIKQLNNLYYLLSELYEYLSMTGWDDIKQAKRIDKAMALIDKEIQLKVKN